MPAEVLVLHALIISQVTTTKELADNSKATTIDDPMTLAVAFFGLLGLSIVLYVVPRLKTWEPMDFFRASIPPLAFVAWTMLQKVTAFDAVAPHLGENQRILIALFAAVLLGVAATALANSADKKVPPAAAPASGLAPQANPKGV